VSNYSEDAAGKALTPAWDILMDVAPALFEEGAYTSGNTQSIQLLGQGAVTMIPAWSDQALSAIAQGVLPETTGLVQLQDLGFPGGFSRITIPTNGVNKDLALKLADFILTPEIQSAVLTELGGFPGVSWDNIDPALREQFADVIPVTIPQFPGGDWDKAVNENWYRVVAPGTDPNA
jgi:putative spermidine/putrescine transport system substrate-binding protein